MKITNRKTVCKEALFLDYCVHKPFFDGIFNTLPTRTFVLQVVLMYSDFEVDYQIKIYAFNFNKKF